MVYTRWKNLKVQETSKIYNKEIKVKPRTITLHEIVQEATSNSQYHKQYNRICVELRHKAMDKYGGQLVLSVDDIEMLQHSILAWPEVQFDDIAPAMIRPFYKEFRR